MPRRRNSRDPLTNVRSQRRRDKLGKNPERPPSMWRSLANESSSRDRYLIETGLDLRIVDALRVGQEYILTARCKSCGRRIASLFAATVESTSNLQDLLKYAFWRSGPESTCTCKGYLPEPAELVDDIVKALAPAPFKSEWRSSEVYIVHLTPDVSGMNT